MGIDAYWRDQPSIQYKYKDSFLHEGTIYAFIAQTAYLADLDGIWRRGIQISEEGVSGRQVAYIEAQPKAIHVWLSSNAKPLLAKVRNLISKLQGSNGKETISLDGVTFTPLSAQSEFEAYFTNSPLSQEDAHDQLVRGHKEGKHEAFQFSQNESKTLPIDQFEEIKTEAQTPPAAKQILFCSASPRDLSLILHKDEFNAAYTELGIRQDKSGQKAFSFWDPLKATDILALQDALYQKPQIIHFAGHGTENGLILDTDKGHGVLLPIEHVPRLFTQLEHVTELVVLNACSTQKMAQAISQHGMYVIGTQFPIKNDPAISFAAGFYAGLGRTSDYQAAFNDGKLKVGTDHPQIAGIYEVWHNGESLPW